MTRRDTVVIGASAGGVEALQVLVGTLPVGFPARVLIVLHLPTAGTDALAAILDRTTELDVRTAEDGEPLREGVVTVGRSDHHLLVGERDEVVLDGAPRDHGHRPSIDRLFASAARVLGPRVVGVVLSGALGDGADGLREIVRQGGVAVVQDPQDALVASMPEHAIAAAGTAEVLPVALIAARLDELVKETELLYG